jgi:hypothetical protein
MKYLKTFENKFGGALVNIGMPDDEVIVCEIIRISFFVEE